MVQTLNEEKYLTNIRPKEIYGSFSIYVSCSKQQLSNGTCNQSQPNANRALDRELGTVHVNSKMTAFLFKIVKGVLISRWKVVFEHIGIDENTELRQST